MNITERTNGNVTILDLAGKIELGEGDVQLRRKIDELTENHKVNVLINLAEVSYIDSAGRGELVRTWTTLRRAGGAAKLLGLTKRISDLLTITKLLVVFDSFENEDAAIATFS